MNANPFIHQKKPKHTPDHVWLFPANLIQLALVGVIPVSTSNRPTSIPADHFACHTPDEQMMRVKESQSTIQD